MIFGLYVHTQTPSFLDNTGRTLCERLAAVAANLTLSEIDGLFLGISSMAGLPSGLKTKRRKVKRDYTLRLPTRQSEHYRYMVELDAYVAEAEVVAASVSEQMLFEYAKSCVLHMLPKALRGFPAEELALLKGVVSGAELNHAPRW